MREALGDGDGDGDADFEALGDGEAEGEGLPLLGDGLAEGAAGAALVTGADAFASSSTASLFSGEPGSAHTATAVPLRATAAAAPMSRASGFRAAGPVRFFGPPPPPPPPPPPASLSYVWSADGIVRRRTVSAGCAACAGPAGPAGHGPSCGGTGIPYAGVSSGAGACGSGATAPDTGCGDTGLSGSAGSDNVTYGRMRKGLKPTPGTHPQPAPAAPHSGQC
ncbi:hypothetical protein ACFWWM_43025 [Streptomyces sp. NPDC058682]|uniref:hypothetical protein n=1 Tax=Streptomyces sp. NPDC058682 TaxID=3346596 RepID=UPI00365DCCA4